MISTTELILCISIILMTGLLFGKIAKKINVPSITGYLVGGVLIGPIIWQLLEVPFDGVVRQKAIDSLAIIADIELAFIAFSVGCEFKISFFKEVGIAPLVIAFFESLAAVVFVTVGMILIGCPLYFALAIGAVAGATAPAATILVIKQYRARGEFTKTLMSVVAIDDTTALIFFGISMAIARSLINTEPVALWVSILLPFLEIFGSILLGVIVGFSLTYIIRFFSSKGNRLVLVIAALFLNIGISLFVKNASFTLGGAKVHIGMSSLMACMVAGAIFTNTNKLVDEVLPLVESITPPFIILFFMLSGADIKFGTMNWMAVAIIVVYIVFRAAGKVFGTFISARAIKASPKVRKYMGFGLLPQGGIALGLSMLVMAELSGDVNLVGNYNGELLRVVILCATFVCDIVGPLLCKFALMRTGEGINPKSRPIETEAKLAESTSES